MDEIQIPPEVRAYMSAIGRKQTPKKTAQNRANLAKGAEARRRDPLTLICTCTGGELLNAQSHKTTCPRGRLLWQRERTAQKKQEEANV